MLRAADVRAFALLLGVGLVLWLPRLSGPLDLRFDAGVYYILGTSIAEGKGYRLLNEPGEIQAVQYPPALPLFVAIHQRLLGTSQIDVVGPALRVSYFLIFMAYVLAVYVLARQWLSPGYSQIVALITSLFLLTYYLSDLLFTEIPFALASVLFILCNRRSERPHWFAACGALGAVAYLLRSAGIALLAAWVVEALIQRRWMQATGRIAVALIPILSWQMYISSVTSSPEYTNPTYPYQRAAYQYYNVPYAQNIMYVDPFQPELGMVGKPGMLARAAYHALIMPPRLGEVVSTKIEFWDWILWDLNMRLGLPKLPHEVAVLPLTLFGLIVLAGAVLLVWRRDWFIPLYLAATIGIVALTPWPGQFARYLTPVAPLLSLCLVLALVERRIFTRDQLAGGRWKRVGAVTMAAVLGIALLMQAYTLARTFRSRPGTGLDRATTGGARLFYYDQTWHAYAAALQWIAQDARPTDVVAASIPHWAYLDTGRKTVMPPMEVDPTTAQAYMEAVPVRYLLIDQVVDVDTARRYGQPAIEHHPDRWQLVLVLEHVGAKNRNMAETRVYRSVDPEEPDQAVEPERQRILAGSGKVGL